MKWYSYIICAVLIIVGIFCTIELVDVFNVKSGEYGQVVTFETENNLNEVFKLDYGTIGFDTEDYSNYSNVTTRPAVDFDGTKETYYLYFNDQPLNNVSQNAGRMSGNIEIKFYDEYGSVVSTAKLNVIIEFLAGETKVSVSINNVDNSVSYLNSYMEINGAVLKVATKGGAA